MRGLLLLLGLAGLALTLLIWPAWFVLCFLAGRLLNARRPLDRLALWPLLLAIRMVPEEGYFRRGRSPVGGRDLPLLQLAAKPRGPIDSLLR